MSTEPARWAYKRSIKERDERLLGKDPKAELFDVLERNGWNRDAAAEELGVTVDVLDGLKRRYGIPKTSGEDIDPKETTIFENAIIETGAITRLAPLEVKRLARRYIYGDSYTEIGKNIGGVNGQQISGSRARILVRNSLKKIGG